MAAIMPNIWPHREVFESGVTVTVHDAHASIETVSRIFTIDFEAGVFRNEIKPCCIRTYESNGCLVTQFFDSDPEDTPRVLAVVWDWLQDMFPEKMAMLDQAFQKRKTPGQSGAET